MRTKAPAAPEPGRGGRFADQIATQPAAEAPAALRASETIGRPLGPAAFLAALAARLGRDPRPTPLGAEAEGRPQKGVW